MPGKKKTPFENVNPATLRFAKPCKWGHHGPDGQGVRKIKGDCLACLYEFPDGPFSHQFTDLQPAPVHRTPEEARQAHIQQVIAYQKRNPEKHKETQKKYNSRPEIKERYAKRSKEYYLENREKVIEYYSQKRKENPELLRSWYERNKERLQAEQRAYYAKNKESILRKRRERYHAEKNKDKE